VRFTRSESRGVRGLLAILLGTRTAPLPADCVLVVARTVLAWVFIYHGARRLFGWFDGPGLHRSADYFAQTAGLHPGVVFAALGGTIEFFGGIALAFGLASRLAGAAIFGDMMMAIITVTWANGINATGGKSGYELNLALGVLALMVAVFGAGRVSVDALLERRLLEHAHTEPAVRTAAGYSRSSST
jgi:putative oxidoreductase